MEAIAETLNGVLTCSTIEDNRINQDLLNLCKAMLVRCRELRGILTAPKPDELHNTARTWAQELREYSISQIAEMFNHAIKEYLDTSDPFGVPNLLAAAQTIERERRQVTNQTAPAAAPRCKRHNLVERPREADDPQNIMGWSECGECGAAFPKLNLTGKGRQYLNLVGLKTAS